MTELLPLLKGRPAILKRDGWTVFVSIHDQAYLREKRVWKRIVAAAHPDKGGTAHKFRKRLSSYRTWKQTERQWYWQFELMPPDWRGGEKVAPPAMVQTRTGKWIEVDRRTIAYKTLTQEASA